MKNFEHPEYQIFHELQQLQKKHPELKDLSELVERVQNIINENAISMTQYAVLYTLLGKDGDLNQETKEKLSLILNSASEHWKK